jgi:predicted ATPase/class 3 adenylate cyclase
VFGFRNEIGHHAKPFGFVLSVGSGDKLRRGERSASERTGDDRAARWSIGHKNLQLKVESAVARLRAYPIRVGGAIGAIADRGAGRAHDEVGLMEASHEATPLERRAALPSGTVTFAFTDIEGSTERWDRDSAAMREALRRHDEIVRTAIAENAGHVFKTIGDAFCAVFGRAEDAIAAMLQAERVLANGDFSAVDGIRMRVALHSGTADERDGDYFGQAVNRVARLVAIGHGGQMLVSGATYELARARLPPNTTLVALGEHRLKDLTAPERVFQIAVPDLPAEFPPLRSLDVHRNNLPAFLTSFVGRENELAEIAALLDTHRLVTLVGSGGIGKTRTSLQIAADKVDGSGDGVWFVELAPLADGDDISATIAREIGATLPTSGDPLENLTRTLSKKRLLLVLDNCEHLVDRVAHVSAALLRTCPNVTILASSREALGIVGEQAFRLPSLDVPVSSDDRPIAAAEAVTSAAVTLFVERARALDQRFALTDDNAATVVDICRRLDGIPLAIELAAARVRVLGPRGLRERLDDRFRVLTSGNRNVLPRQQTLRALIDWSHDLLDERERALFRCLGIFANGFTLEAAVALGTTGDLDEYDVFDVLSSLVDKSLVLAERTADVEALRYRLLESTRAYALERIHDANEFEMLARRRTAFFEAFAGDGTTFTANIVARFDAVDPELENIRETLRWALDEGHDVEGGARIAYALGRYWIAKVPREGLRWIELARARLPSGTDPVLSAGIDLALAAMLPHGTFERVEATEAALAACRAAGDPLLVAMALCSHGDQLSASDRYVEADATFSEPLSIARELGRTWDAARALAGLSTIAIDAGDVDRAQRLGGEAIEMFAEIGAADGVAYASALLGQMEFSIGRFEQATALLSSARDAYAAMKNVRSHACDETYLAGISLVAGDADVARQHARSALDLLRSDRHPLYLTAAIGLLGHVATLRGNPQRGARLFGYVENAWRLIALSQSEIYGQANEHHMRALTEALGPGELAQLRAEGAAFSEDRAISEAMEI